MQIRVEKKFIRISPDKIRLVAEFIKNKDAEIAISELKFIGKSAASTVIEIIKSGISAAKDKDLDINKLQIKNIIVNEGAKLKRRRIIHRGRATAIAKRTSHIILILDDNENNKKPHKITDKNKNIKTVNKNSQEKSRPVKGEK